MKKGQYIRLLLALDENPDMVIAAAKQLALHGSAQTEESSTKDTTGDAQEFDVTGLSYDITGSGLVLTTNDDLISGALSLDEFELFTENNRLIYWRICLMEGTHNRTVVEDICSGTARLTNLRIDAPNKQNTSFSYTLSGVGPIALPDLSNSEL